MICRAPNHRAITIISSRGAMTSGPTWDVLSSGLTTCCQGSSMSNAQEPTGAKAITCSLLPAATYEVPLCPSSAWLTPAWSCREPSKVPAGSAYSTCRFSSTTAMRMKGLLGRIWRDVRSKSGSRAEAAITACSPHHTAHLTLVNKHTTERYDQQQPGQGQDDEEEELQHQTQTGLHGRRGRTKKGGMGRPACFTTPAPARAATPA